jgi:hypothetical protein
MGMASFNIKSITPDENGRTKTVVVEINQFSILEMHDEVEKLLAGADEAVFTSNGDDTLIFRMYYAEPKKLPSSVDLRSQLPPVVDQGDLGSSAACAVAAAIEAINIKTNEIREQ